MANETLIKIVADKKFAFGGEGTKRRESWDALRSAKRKTVAAYKAAGGQVKYLSRWEKAGYIAIAA